MLVHKTTRQHWTIGGTHEGRGISCPNCGAAAHMACIRKGKRLPRTEVHVQRVEAMGHRVNLVAMPVHRAKIPAGALAELKARIRA